MKKQIVLLVLAPIALASCAAEPLVNNIRRLSESDVSANFVDFFSSTYRVTSSVTNGESKQIFSVIDEVSSSAKTNLVYQGTNLVSSFYVVSEAGFAKEQYLDLTNTIKTRDIGSSAVSFKDNYGSPMAKVMKSVSSIGDYWSISSSNGVYTYTANAKGLETASISFNTFFSFYGDTYSWHTKTLSEYVESLSITSDSEGYPSSMDFVKVKKDRYGAIRETYSCVLESIEEVTSLTPCVYQGSAESLEALTTSLGNLTSMINAANFRQEINLPIIKNTAYYNTYDFDATGYGAMICDLPFSESEHGLTYLGLAYSYIYDSYYMAAVSPNDDYYGATTDDYFDTLEECLPCPSDIGAAFFSYDEANDSYSFDLDTFVYDDYYFCFSILDALFGVADPCADKFGYYLNDFTNYVFDFRSLDIKIDKTSGLPSFALSFNAYTDEVVTMTTSFDKFGTIDLASDPDLGYAYSLLL